MPEIVVGAVVVEYVVCVGRGDVDGVLGVPDASECVDPDDDTVGKSLEDGVEFHLAAQPAVHVAGGEDVLRESCGVVVGVSADHVEPSLAMPDTVLEALLDGGVCMGLV